MAARVEAPRVAPEIPEGAPVYAPSPTCEDFIHACAAGPLGEFRVLVLMGPRGEGKTSAALFALVALGQRLQMEGLGARLPLRVAVIRDTFENLTRTTIPTIQKQVAKGLPVEFFDGNKQCRLGLWAHLYFFGMDNRKDVDKLQGFE